METRASLPLAPQGPLFPKSSCPGALANTSGKPASDQTLKCSMQAGSKGRALLLVVSKQNLNPSYWRIWHTKNHLK
jgi:hypothetical protein